MNAPQAIDPITDAAAFRAALGRFATGVTIITTTTEDGPVGIVANSFASVSLDPPLVLWSPAKASFRFNDFVAAPHFAIHVMGAEQQDLCTQVLQSKTAVASADMRLSETGTPLLTGAIATFECDFEASHDAGDHVIVVGRVRRLHHSEGDPLVFHDGKYGSFRADRWFLNDG